MFKKSVYKLIIIAIVCFQNLSCAMETKDQPYGNITFVLPSSTASRAVDNPTYPESYKVTLTSSSNEIIHNEIYKAGDTVHIGYLKYGQYTISVLGSTPSEIFSKTQNVTIDKKNNSVTLILQSTKLTGDIEITLKNRSTSPFIQYYYSLDDGKTKLPYTKIDANKDSTIIKIPSFKPNTKYTITCYAYDGNEAYVATKQGTIQKGKVSKVLFDSFTLYTGSIELSQNGGTPIENITVTVNDNITNEIVKTVNISSLPYTIKGLLPNKEYKLSIFSNNDNYTYSCNDIIKIQQGITSKPHYIISDEYLSFYVRTFGLDTNDGSEQHPLKTIQKAITIAQTQNKTNVKIIIDGEYNLEKTIIIPPKFNLIIMGKTSYSSDKIVPNSTLVNLYGPPNGVYNGRPLGTIKFTNIQLTNNINSGKELRINPIMNVIIGENVLINKECIITVSEKYPLTISGKPLNPPDNLLNIYISPNPDKNIYTRHPVIKTENNVSVQEIMNLSTIKTDASYELNNEAILQVKNNGAICDFSLPTTATEKTYTYTLTNSKGVVVKNNEPFPTDKICTNLDPNETYTLEIFGLIDKKYNYYTKYEGLKINQKITLELQPTTGSFTINNTKAPSTINPPLNVDCKNLRTNEIKKLEISSFPYSIDSLKEGEYSFTITNGTKDELYTIPNSTITLGTTTSVDGTYKIKNTYYVNCQSGKDDGLGTEASPYRTINNIISTLAEDEKDITINYTGNNVTGPSITPANIPSGLTVHINGTATDNSYNKLDSQINTINGNVFLNNVQFNNITVDKGNLTLNNVYGTKVTVNSGNLNIENEVCTDTVELKEIHPINVNGKIGFNLELLLPKYEDNTKVINFALGFTPETGNKGFLITTKERYYLINNEGKIYREPLNIKVSRLHTDVTNGTYQLIDANGNVAHENTFTATEHSFIINSIPALDTYTLKINGTNTDSTISYPHEGTIIVKDEMQEGSNSEFYVQYRIPQDGMLPVDSGIKLTIDSSVIPGENLKYVLHDTSGVNNDITGFINNNEIKLSHIKPGNYTLKLSNTLNPNEVYLISNIIGDGVENTKDITLDKGNNVILKVSLKQ